MYSVWPWQHPTTHADLAREFMSELIARLAKQDMWNDGDSIASYDSADDSWLGDPL